MFKDRGERPLRFMLNRMPCCIKRNPPVHSILQNASIKTLFTWHIVQCVCAGMDQMLIRALSNLR